MDNDIKIAQFYDPDKMRKAIMYAEQFWMLCHDMNLDEKNRICAKRLHEHYKRLALCIMAKEFPEDFKTDLVVDTEYMKNMYKGYAS